MVASAGWGGAKMLGRQLGEVAWKWDRTRRKERTVRDLARAFPEFSPARARKVVRSTYRSLFEGVTEALYLYRRVANGRLRDIVEFVGGEKLPSGENETGVIFATGHFACWELMGLVSTAVGYPVVSVARPLNNPLLNRYVRELRESAGQRLIPKKGAIREALQALKRGENLAFLIDQDARRQGIFVEFFGRPASTHTSVARLAISTGAPAAFVYARRLHGEKRFRVVVDDVIWPRADADREEEIFRITQRLTSDLEKVVRRWPGQWLWMHRRWKTYPGKYENQPCPSHLYSAGKGKQ